MTSRSQCAIGQTRSKIRRQDKRLNLLATNLTKEVEKYADEKENYLKIYVPDGTVIYRAYATGHMLFKTCINCQMYYEMLRQQQVTACNNPQDEIRKKKKESSSMLLAMRHQ